MADRELVARVRELARRGRNAATIAALLGRDQPVVERVLDVLGKFDLLRR